MIYAKVDVADYKREFKKKFNNFGNKAPIRLSFAIDDNGVTIIHENSKTEYHYEWDFGMSVQSFIHEIKKELSYNHYPVISREETITRPLTNDEVAELLASGMKVDDIPETKTYTKVENFRIDKIIVMNDEFIIINEETGEQYCYRMVKSGGIFFLDAYRKGVYHDPKEAGDAFFEKSVLVSKLTNLRNEKR